MNTDLGSVNLSPSVGVSTDPIVEYMFNTAADAINQAKAWGFDGYRVYLINGQLQYIPCATSAQYEQATRLYVEQGAVVAQGVDVFGDALVGYQYTAKNDLQGEPIFTLGNFSITTTISQNQSSVYTLADAQRSYTAQDFTLDGIDALKSQILTNVTATVRFDNSNIEKYVTYASLSERFRICMQEIVETFPASMHITPHSIAYPCLFDYQVYQNGDAAVFKVRIGNIANPFNIDFYKSGTTAPAPQYVAPVRNFALNFTQYELYYNSTSYQIINCVPPTGVKDPNNLIITVLGDPFSDVVSPSGAANVSFYIKPQQAVYDSFYTTASDLASYLLNQNSTPQYLAVFNVPNRQDDGTFVITPTNMQFPIYDDFNVDVFTDAFDLYLSNLNAIAGSFDEYKTDLIARFLTSDSLQEYDTDDRKTYITLQAYGHMFDQVKQYADGIAYMTNVSYDKIDNVPDVLLKNFAHMLGWETYEIEDESTLVQSLFDINKTQGSETPQEVDIELWRRIIINSFYLFKSKGTRKGIEFALELVGVPLEIMDINEYVYVAQNPLDYDRYYQIFNGNIYNYPIDSDGYPTTPPNIYFQANGGNMLNDAQNIGPYDGGQSYIGAYTNFDVIKGFDLIRTVDNKKSWVIATGATNQNYDLLLRDTDYDIKDSRLVINSKEADAAISSQMTFDYYVYSFYADNNYTISVSGATVTPSTISFNDYLREILTKLINPRNRKVVHKYPVLSKIYSDYLIYSGKLGKQTIDYANTLAFISQFDSYWVNLVQQFIPATTIFVAGKKYDNSNLSRNKFVYKHGLNKSKKWLGTDGSEFQDSALKPSLDGYYDIFQATGYLHKDFTSNNVVLIFSCQLSTKASSYLIRGGAYEADNYGYYRRYADSQNILSLEQGNYGTMSGLVPVGAGSNTNLLYFASHSGLPGYHTIGNVLPAVSGTTYDDNLGAGYYAGMTSTGTTGSAKIVLAALPTSGALYPLQKLIIMGLNNIPIEPNEYYIMEGDIKLTFSVSGNTAYSYIGLVPFMTGVTTPDGIVSDRDMIEGCLGQVKYDKYNWIHMKTKFRANQNYIQMVLMAQDIHYSGTGILYLQNFTVTKAPTDIDFITPPPMPHVCYFDNTGLTVNPFTDVLTYTNFTDTVFWLGSMGIGSPPDVSFGVHSTDDYWITTFKHSNGGKGSAQQTYSDTFAYTPTANTVYYWSVDVAVTGSTGLTYIQQPTVYFHPLLDDTWTGVFPFMMKGNLQQKFVRFEGYYLPLTLGTNPKPSFSVQNLTPLTSVLGNFSVKLSNFKLKKVNLYYEDIDGNPLWYRQPHAFGYSNNTGTTQPTYAVGGSPTKWVIPYIPLGGTGYTGDVSGMYEQYFNLTRTFPLMHTSRAYVNKYALTVGDTFIDINLTHTCGLEYKFYENGGYPGTCITPDGATVENQLFMSGSMAYTFEGFYPTTGVTVTGVGPFYTPKPTYGIYATFGVNDATCYATTNNYISIVNTYGQNWATLAVDTGYTETHKVPPDFQSALSTVGLASRSDSKYLVVNRYNLIKIESKLIYDSDIDTAQTVIVKLADVNGQVYNQQSYTVGGSSNPLYTSLASRTLSYTFSGYYYVNDEIYLVVQPKDFDCTIKTGEDINCAGGYILNGSTGDTFSHFTASRMLSGTGYTYTYFTGDTYQFMDSGVYDILSFIPTGILGTVPSAAMLSEHTDVYDHDFEYYMAFMTGTTLTGKTINIQSNAVDNSNYPTTYAYHYAIRQLPPPFTGVTWTTYDATGIPSGHTYNSLTGNTYTITRKSYVKVYESNVSGTTVNMENELIAFYKNNNVIYYKDGYNKNFFDDPINKFFAASDATSREVFAYGAGTVHAENDGIYLRYDIANDMAGYPVTGEFIGRLTGKDMCGNFATIYLLLFIDLQANSYVVKATNINASAVENNNSVSLNISSGNFTATSTPTS